MTTSSRLAAGSSTYQDLRPHARGLDEPGTTQLYRPASVGAIRRVPLVELPRFDIGPLIGEGGMGVLMTAEQRSLERQVVVKRLRPEFRGDLDLQERLLNEARLTGSLEHPNIVPVHDIGVDPEGEPFVVLRRIDGLEWSALMGDGEAVERLFGQRDLLEWNLRVLMQVCNAIHYAHSRKVVHRDIKPDNVMIGAFGEVYLLDWGLAMNIGCDAPRQDLPAQCVGTPAYMAPEMLSGRAADVSARTDVYLLGATLYECLAGAPPHRGATVVDALASIASADPPAPAGAPPELLDILGRAMRREPTERFAGAEQLRLALQGFLEHRGSLRLSSDAWLRLDRLRSVLATLPLDGSGLRERIYALLSVCRFGFQGALSMWPGNTQARNGLRDALVAVAEYELQCGHPHAAAALIAESSDVADELRARIEAVLTSTRDAHTRLAALARDHDRGVGRSARLRLSSALALAWVVMPFGLVTFVPSEVLESHVFLIAASLLLVAFIAGVGVAARDVLRQTALNRHVFGAFVLLAVGQLALAAGSALAELPPVVTITHGFILWFCVATMLTFTADRRIAPTSVACLLAFLGVSASPEARYYLISAVGAAFWLNSVLIWRYPDWLAVAEE